MKFIFILDDPGGAWRTREPQFQYDADGHFQIYHRSQHLADGDRVAQVCLYRGDDTQASVGPIGLSGTFKIVGHEFRRDVVNGPHYKTENHLKSTAIMK